MLELVSGASGERDARPERQSSWLRSLREVRERLAAAARPLQLAFASFVGWHLCLQAYRADADGALPGTTFERTPGFVAGVFLLLWLPFLAVSVRELARSLTRGTLEGAAGQERALLTVEPLALVVVLLFGSVHGALMVWPLLSGALDEADLKAELVADLSSTWHGVPMRGMVYLCAVGAASFYAARLVLARLPAGRSGLARAVVGLAVLACLLGSYAVIRNGSGPLLP